MNVGELREELAQDWSDTPGMHLHLVPEIQVMVASDWGVSAAAWRATALPAEPKHGLPARFRIWAPSEADFRLILTSSGEVKPAAPVETGPLTVGALAARLADVDATLPVFVHDENGAQNEAAIVTCAGEYETWFLRIFVNEAQRPIDFDAEGKPLADARWVQPASHAVDPRASWEDVTA